MKRSADSLDCLAQADLLLLLAEMLGTPAGWTGADRRTPGGELATLAERSTLGGLNGGDALLREAFTAWHATDLEAASAEYYRLFDGTLACPPNETIYVRRDKGAVLADIAGFYRAFGFELAEGFGEKHDHIVAELQFAALLFVLVGRAVQAGRPDQREIADDALAGFLRDHLGIWIGSFAARLEASAALPFYIAVARLLAATWATLKASEGLADLEDADEPRAEKPGTPYECGMCEGPSGN